MSSEAETSQAWLEGARSRARSALRSASAPGDRLALLRELARLFGGRFSLASEDVSLSADEMAMLRRFRLACTDGKSLRLLDGELGDDLDGWTAATRLDPELRTAYAEAPADAPLLRAGGRRSYRSGTQRAAMGAMLTMPSGASLMVSMPTGSGKSLLFQAGVLLWRRHDPGACVIVFTPTISLADDHVRTLRQIPGLEGSRALTGAVQGSEREALLDSFRRGEVPVLLLSPEAAFGNARNALAEAALPPERKFGLSGRLVAVFIDEAHIVESWGRTFRPEFQRLPALIDLFRASSPNLKTVLLSATLNDAARTVLRQAYASGAWLEVHAGVPRYDFDILARAFEDRVERDKVLLSVLDLVPRPAIVYTTRVRDAEALHATLIGERGYARVGLFTGSIGDPVERRTVVEDWSADRMDLVVATSAFGLGIDKADVRTVVHACLPESSSRWYQEVGRASRDGRQGLSVTLWTRDLGRGQDSDEDQAFLMASTSWLSRELAEARWRALRDTAVAGWTGARRCLRLPLDAAREGLGRRTGERNRRWNMSLLNLLQRAGAVRIDLAEGRPDAPAWDVTLIDDALLADGAAWDAVWDRVYAVRAVEMGGAIRDLRAFRDLMADDVDCVLRGVFDMIEPGGWDVPRCGRCPHCRRVLAPLPGRIHAEGLNGAWPLQPASSVLPTGVLVVSPLDVEFAGGLPELLDRLVRVGIEQFVVSDGLVGPVAQHLATSRCRYGFVWGSSDWLRGETALHALGIAVLVHPEDHLVPLLRKARSYADLHGGLPVVIVASPQRSVNGRALSQVASPMAAFDELSLDDFTDRISEDVA